MKAEMTPFIWVRHAPSWRPTGHVPAHDPDIIPNDRAADALAHALPESACWHISPLKRCQQTAQQIEQAMIAHGRIASSEKTNTPAIIEQDLGDWAGAKLDDVWRELKTEKKHNFSFQTPDLMPPNGESFAQQYIRISAYLDAFSKTVETSQERRVQIFFAHAHTIRAVIAYCLKLPLETALSIQIDNYSRTSFNFLASAQAQGAGGQWQVTAINAPAN